MKKAFIVLTLILLSTNLFALASKESESRIVELWHSNSGKVGEVFDQIISDFNEGPGKDAGIEIEAIYQGKANDVLTKVKAASGTKTLPNIAQMDATSGYDMSSSDYVVSMDDLSLDLTNILPLALSGFKYNDKQIAMPFNSSALLLYYNKTLFDSLGINPPKTMDEMIEVANALNGKIDYAFAGVPTTSELTTLLGAQNGLSYLTNNNNGHSGKATKVLFGENGTYKNFLEKWKLFYQTGMVNNITQGVTTEFAAKRTAMMLASSSNLSTVISTVANNFEVGVAAVPMVDKYATGGVCVGGGAMYAFQSDEATRTVLEYLASEDVQMKWAEGTGYIPINTKLYERDDYKAFLEKNPSFAVAMDAIRNSNKDLTNLWIPSGYQVYYSFQKNVVDVITSKIDIDQGVKEMADYVQSALDGNV